MQTSFNTFPVLLYAWMQEKNECAQMITTKCPACLCREGSTQVCVSSSAQSRDMDVAPLIALFYARRITHAFAQ